MELKANELRLNNLCYRTNKLTKEKILIELTASCILDISANGEMSSFIYEPIPLTEEWILKFGFLNDKVLEFYKNNSSELTIIIDYNFICLLGYSHVKLKYVHQLQNIIFALTNKELEM